ncbi:MAG TPA: DUF3426 domain-containing protein [Caulobacteraceae bacterium]|nr:DUF3426 domain-containing protein [Caulobacteraceae bacterium]
MILTCPQCATGYFVEDGQITAEGRSVRCAHCGHRWTAFPETPHDLASDGAAALASQAPLKPAVSPVSEAVVTLTGDDLPRQFRNRAEEDRRMRQAAINGAIWAAAAVAVAIVVGLGVVFREAVVRAWPQTASAYAAIGLAVNPTGLVIEQVRADPALQEGHAALAISGVIRNVVGRDVTAPPLRITLLNAQGKRVAGQIAALGNARIPPGETRHFVTSIYDPPFSAANLQVDFAPGAHGAMSRVAAQTPSAQAAPMIALRGPAGEPPATAPQLPPGPAAAPPPAFSAAVATAPTSTPPPASTPAPAPTNAPAKP